MAMKLGFQVEGTLRNQVFIDGEYHDSLRMGLFPHEFRKFTLRKLGDTQGEVSGTAPLKAAG